MAPLPVATEPAALVPPRPGFFHRVWLRFLGFEPGLVKDTRVRKATRNPGENRVRLAEMIAKQIEVEQGLANTRMMWNLTFQGFTIAGYALVASSSGTNPSRLILETLIAAASIVIGYATLRGIVASQVQRQYLKDSWAENDLTRFFPEPFSVTRTSSLGRFPAYIICIALILMWASLIVVQFVWEGDDDKAYRVEMTGSAPKTDSARQHEKTGTTSTMLKDQR